MTTTPPAAPLSTRARIDFAIAIILLVAFVVIGRTWLAEHDARLKAEASIAAAQKSFDQAAADSKRLADEQKARDAQTAVTITKLSEAAAAQKTPQQITNWIPAQLGKPPEPIRASIAQATPQNPTPPAVFTVPQADLGFLRDEIATCQKNAVALPSAQQDLSSCEARAKDSAQKLQDMTKERDALQEELKGGTFWQRVKGGTKKVAIGVGIGVLTVCATGHCK